MHRIIAMAIFISIIILFHIILFYILEQIINLVFYINLHFSFFQLLIITIIYKVIKNINEIKIKLR
jgi:hypothetical protein